MSTTIIPQSSSSPSTAAIVPSTNTSTEGSNNSMNKNKKKGDDDDDDDAMGDDVDKQQQPREFPAASCCIGNNSNNQSKSKDKNNNKQKEEEEMISLTLTLQDPRIWKALAASGYLDCKDMGRLFLLTWKNWGLDGGEEGAAAAAVGEAADNTNCIWKFLCQSYWGRDGANSLLRISGIHPKEYFHMFAYPAKHKDKPLPPPLPPPKFTPEDYVLIVEARTDEDELLFTKAVDGSIIPEFFTFGETKKIDLDEPLLDIYKLGERTYKDHDEYYDSLLQPRADKWIHLGWKGTVHLIRKSDGKLLPLVDVSDVHEIIQPKPCGLPMYLLRGNEEDYNHEQRAQGYLVTSVGGIIPSQFQQIASGWRDILLQQHLGIDHDLDEGWCALGCLEAEINLDYKLKLSESGVAWLDVHSFYIQVALNFEQCSSPLSEHLTEKGLQYAQVLEALSEWKIAPTVNIHPHDYFNVFAYPAEHKKLLPPPLPPLPPPQFTPKDYALIVEIRTHEDELLFTKAVDGSTIPEFFISGNTSKIDLDKPLLDIYKLGEKTYQDHDDYYDSLLQTQPDNSIELFWKGTAHLIRKPDGKILPLFDTSESDICETIQPKPGNEEDYDREQRTQGHLETKIDWSFPLTPFQQFATGWRDIPVQQHLGIDHNLVENWWCGFGCLEARINLNYKLRLSESGVAWVGIHSFCIDVWLWHDESGEPLSRRLTDKGLQHAQVLEALSDWQVVNGIGG